MNNSIHSPKLFLGYLIKFIGLFLFFYIGTQIITGLSTPGQYYNQFVHDYLNYPDWLRYSLMKGAALVAGLFGYETYEGADFLLKVKGRRGVIISYSCAGYAVMSFWAAFTLSASMHLKSKLTWLFFGLLTLWLINIARIGLFLVALNKNWPMPLGLDHHTWFNIFSYGFILTMMYVFDRKNDLSPRTPLPSERG